MGNENDKIHLTKQEAISALPEGDRVHTFRNSPVGLLGADMSREDLIELLGRYEHTIEIGGQQCMEIGHGLVVIDKIGDPPAHAVLFIQASSERLTELEKQKTGK